MLKMLLPLMLVLAIAEWWAPRRARAQPRTRRWITNFALTPLDVLVVFLVYPVLDVGMAFWAERDGFGLFQWIGLPASLVLVLSFVLIDFSVWAQHWALHQVRVLWPLHRVHHSDPDVDFTTAHRFHPFEAIWTVGVKLAMVAAIGPPVAAVLIYDMVYPIVSHVGHSNVRLPLALDRLVRPFVVTPDFHRVHHSTADPEFEKNYGAVMTLWDRLFGTYLAQPRLGHERMSVGLAEYPDAEKLHLLRLLAMPFDRVPHGGSGPGRERSELRLEPSSERA